MASIAPKTDVLGYHKAAHLLRRASFKITKSMINEYALKTPAQALEDLFVFTPPNPPAPLTNSGQTYIPTVAQPTIQAVHENSNVQRFFDHWFLLQAITSTNLEYKLTIWLHLMFIVDTRDTRQYSCFDYIELMRFHANKSIKDLAIRVTKDVRMLSYLNTIQNTKNSPNQNYAREFLELFTILKGEQVGSGDYTNYTEHDVQQAARVFTGFTANASLLYSSVGRLSHIDPITNLPAGIINTSTHDTGNKTFSYAFNNAVITGASTVAGIQAEMESFVTMVFNQPETAKNYCRRLYRYFVGRNITPEIETDIITPLATTMMANNYNIVPVVKQLMTSKHFYDEDDTISGDEVLGALVKSPLDLLLQMYTIFEVAIPNYNSNPSSIHSFMGSLLGVSAIGGFNLHNPTTVNGYTAYSEAPHYDKNWITTASLRARYTSSIDDFINAINRNGHRYQLVTPTFVKNSGHFSNPANAVTLMQEFYDLLFVATPQGDRHTYFYNILLGGLSTINWQMEWNNYLKTNNTTAVKTALDRLVRAMVKSPEFQVF